MSKRIGKVICVIPDCQIRPGVPLDHLGWIGNYIAEKRPDVIVNIGDWADMPSLSSYAVGKAPAEGQRYVADIEAAREGMKCLMAPIKAVRGYRPSLHLTLGNHEDRITREVEANPRLIGTISVKDLQYEKWGWKVHPFLKIINIYGFEFSHYFTSGVMGRPVSSAAALLRTRHSSAVMGHVQTTDIAFHQKSGHLAIIAGCCYLHEEAYLTPQMEGKAQRRQVVMLNEVENGIGDPYFVSLRYLRSKFS